MSDFLRVSDRSGEELVKLLELAIDLESRFTQRREDSSLTGYRVAMW
ncbi:MAG: ornithine carbamoyltransferase [Acidimicrobiales bacterium]|jgi:ornithine carbamoyltransferase